MQPLRPRKYREPSIVRSALPHSRNLEVDFPNRFALDGIEGVRSITTMNSDAAKRILADELGALIGLLMEFDAVRAMDLVIGEDAIL